MLVRIQKKLFEINSKLLGFCTQKQNNLLELLCIYNYNFSDVKSLIEFINLDKKKLELESHHQLLLHPGKTQLSYCVETVH